MEKLQPKSIECRLSAVILVSGNLNVIRTVRLRLVGRQAIFATPIINQLFSRHHRSLADSQEADTINYGRHVRN